MAYLAQRHSQVCNQGVSQDHSHLTATREGPSSKLTHIPWCLLVTDINFLPYGPICRQGSSQHDFWLPLEGMRERPGEKREQVRQKTLSFWNLILQVTRYHFCHFVCQKQVARSSPHSRGLHRGMIPGSGDPWGPSWKWLSTVLYVYLFSLTRYTYMCLRISFSNSCQRCVWASQSACYLKLIFVFFFILSVLLLGDSLTISSNSLICSSVLFSLEFIMSSEFFFNLFIFRFSNWSYFWVPPLPISYSILMDIALSISLGGS